MERFINSFVPTMALLLGTFPNPVAQYPRVVADLWRQVIPEDSFWSCAWLSPRDLEGAVLVFFLHQRRLVTWRYRGRRQSKTKTAVSLFTAGLNALEGARPVSFTPTSLSHATSTSWRGSSWSQGSRGWKGGEVLRKHSKVRTKVHIALLLLLHYMWS